MGNLCFREGVTGDGSPHIFWDLMYKTCPEVLFYHPFNTANTKLDTLESSSKFSFERVDDMICDGLSAQIKN